MKATIVAPILLALSSALLADPTDVVTLRGGTILRGEILSEDGAGVALRVAPGEVLVLSPKDVSEVKRGVDPDSPPPFLRFREGASTDALQSGVATYLEPKSGKLVTLVGAVHVGDAEYFGALQKLLDGHAVVLYEGVGGGAKAADLEEISFVFRLQVEVGRLLGLTFQKDGIDYGREHFRNADMAWPEMKAALEAKGQTLVPMQGFLRLLSPFLEGLLSSQRAMLERSGRQDAAAADLKRTLGRMLAQGPELLERLGIVDSRKRDDVIVSLRNEAAFRVLDKVLEGPERSIAVFYGAAHLPDMHRRLIERGLSLRSSTFVDAWRIAKRASK